MSFDPISPTRTMAIAKIIRNAELPDEYSQRLVRDFCVFFGANNPEFDKKRFVSVCSGNNYRSVGWQRLLEFDTIKYLDEVWDGINKRKYS